MKRADRAPTYTPLDFLEWREGGSLVLVPKFQRREVWSTPARSYLIDSLLRDMPIPPIYLRVTQSDDKKRIIREVVDGQQRVKAVLGFIDGEFALSRALDAPYAGKRFDQLEPDQQDTIRQYGFICEVFHGLSDAQVLEIFARLNTYSVKLNAQELRNGTYFGFFKQSVYRLAREHIEFWRQHRLFSEQSIARMKEVEFTSELVIAQMDGQQDKKGSINRFYADYDEDFPKRAILEERFRSCLDTINETFGDVLKQTEFRRAPLFYSLFCVVFHRSFGLPKQPQPTPKKRLTEVDQRALLDAVRFLSEKVTAWQANDGVPAAYMQFVTASVRQTDNIGPRQKRFHALYGKAFGHQ